MKLCPKSKIYFIVKKEEGKNTFKNNKNDFLKKNNPRKA
jgi:hypothetical protein